MSSSSLPLSLLLPASSRLGSGAGPERIGVAVDGHDYPLGRLLPVLHQSPPAAVRHSTMGFVLSLLPLLLLSFSLTNEDQSRVQTQPHPVHGLQRFPLCKDNPPD
jgi:hypothetical protein